MCRLADWRFVAGGLAVISDSPCAQTSQRWVRCRRRALAPDRRVFGSMSLLHLRCYAVPVVANPQMSAYLGNE